MSVLALMPLPHRAWLLALGLLLIAGLGAGAAWTAQDWRYGYALAEQARQSAESAEGRVGAVLTSLKTAQEQRATLERRLHTNDETHYKELTDARKAHQRLFDRLATADVRLSVLLSSGAGGPGGHGLPTAAGAGSVVYGATRAELNPAHAQRIIGITDDGDQGLIALAACQAYAKEVSTPK